MPLILFYLEGKRRRVRNHNNILVYQYCWSSSSSNLFRVHTDYRQGLLKSKDFTFCYLFSFRFGAPSLSHLLRACFTI